MALAVRFVTGESVYLYTCNLQNKNNSANQQQLNGKLIKANEQKN